MRKLGWIEGQNLQNEVRWSAADPSLGRVDKPDPDANAGEQHESRKAFDELVVSGGDAAEFLARLKKRSMRLRRAYTSLSTACCIFRLAKLGITASPPRCWISRRTASLSYPLSPSICSFVLGQRQFCEPRQKLRQIRHQLRAGGLDRCRAPAPGI
jgi:hypothetical protein